MEQQRGRDVSSWSNGSREESGLQPSHWQRDALIRTLGGRGSSAGAADE